MRTTSTLYSIPIDSLATGILAVVFSCKHGTELIASVGSRSTANSHQNDWPTLSRLSSGIAHRMLPLPGGPRAALH
jgi:hypothetical protein